MARRLTVQAYDKEEKAVARCNYRTKIANTGEAASMHVLHER